MIGCLIITGSWEEKKRPLNVFEAREILALFYYTGWTEYDQFIILIICLRYMHTIATLLSFPSYM